jgi:L-alanine-DL-glutamate epimerase-like enolase superfamily enzyme
MPNPLAKPPPLPRDSRVTLTCRPHVLQLAHAWRIASSSGAAQRPVALLELTDDDGLAGLGEVSLPSTSTLSVESILEFCRRLDPSRLSFADVPASLAWLDALDGLPVALRCGLNVALLDGAARYAGLPLHDFLRLGFREGRHVTSFSIGLDAPERIYTKTLAAADYPVLKLKLGDAHDRDNLAALRRAAPHKPVRVDANEAWTTKEHALEMLEWLAQDGAIQFVEQPMPRGTGAPELRWLKERSPLPLFADEACHSARDIPHCVECYHGVNVKLVKAGGPSPALETLRAARQAGLQTMLGCMIETSVLISAAAHLAELADHLDLDGNLLTTNDPFAGVTAEKGVVSFAGAAARTGLRVTPRK